MYLISFEIVSSPLDNTYKSRHSAQSILIIGKIQRFFWVVLKVMYQARGKSLYWSSAEEATTRLNIYLRWAELGKVPKLSSSFLTPDRRWPRNAPNPFGQFGRGPTRGDVIWLKQRLYWLIGTWKFGLWLISFIHKSAKMANLPVL